MTATQTEAPATGEKLLGRVAFVTGGTRGIGAAICRSLAAQGADVAAGYSGNQQAAEQMGITDSHAGVLLHRARAALREHLAAFDPHREARR